MTFMGYTKNTAFVFLLLANIALFAHAAVPHHHHTAQDICFCDRFHTEAACHDCDGKDHGSPCAPEGDDTNASCQATKYFVVRASSADEDRSVHYACDHDHFHCLYAALQSLAACTPEASKTGFKSFESVPPDFHGRAVHGLRAPPVRA